MNHPEDDLQIKHAVELENIDIINLAYAYLEMIDPAMKAGCFQSFDQNNSRARYLDSSRSALRHLETC